MQKIEATFRIVTPMFIGGADQTPSDGIRPPSVKGALRFWWRALNWGRFYTHEQDEAKALKELHKKEAELFGRAAEGDEGGQGCFILNVAHKKNINPEKQDILDFTGKAYLAGMGLAGRTALPREKDFVISLRFRKHTESELIESMNEIIRVFGLFGGLGSRSRRGFGSIVRLIEKGDKFRPPTEKEIKKDCDWLKTKMMTTRTSPFSAFDANSLFYTSNDAFGSADDAMEKVGKLLNRFRTSGTSSVPNKGPPPEGERYVSRNTTVPIEELNFYTTDHHQVNAISSNTRLAASNGVAPKRSIFGLPHQYKFSSGKKVSFDFMSENEKGRRASPLFIHISAFTNSQGSTSYRPFLLLLQARFLPPNAKLDVLVDQQNVGQISAPSDYTPIHKFLSTHFDEC